MLTVPPRKPAKRSALMSILMCVFFFFFRMQSWVDLCPITCWKSQGFACKVTRRGTTTSSTGCVPGHQRTSRRNYTWTPQTVSGSVSWTVFFLNLRVKVKEARVFSQYFNVLQCVFSLQDRKNNAHTYTSVYTCRYYCSKERFRSFRPLATLP